jgi:hypothetical protein
LWRWRSAASPGAAPASSIAAVGRFASAGALRAADLVAGTALVGFGAGPAYTTAHDLSK